MCTIRTHNTWVATLKVRVTACRPMTSLFEVGLKKLFHRNDHHIEMTCREQHLGRYLEGQRHSMTLQQKLVRPITLLF